MSPTAELQKRDIADFHREVMQMLAREKEDQKQAHLQGELGGAYEINPTELTSDDQEIHELMSELAQNRPALHELDTLTKRFAEYTERVRASANQSRWLWQERAANKFAGIKAAVQARHYQKISDTSPR